MVCLTIVGSAKIRVQWAMNARRSRAGKAAIWVATGSCWCAKRHGRSAVVTSRSCTWRGPAGGGCWVMLSFLRAGALTLPSPVRGRGFGSRYAALHIRRTVSGQRLAISTPQAPPSRTVGAGYLPRCRPRMRSPPPDGWAVPRDSPAPQRHPARAPIAGRSPLLPTCVPHATLHPRPIVAGQSPLPQSAWPHPRPNSQPPTPNPQPPTPNARLTELGAVLGAGQRAIDDLGDLAPRGVGELAEVGAVLAVARLAGAATGIARDDAVADGGFHEGVERCAGRHIAEGRGGRDDQLPAGGDGGDFRELAAGDVGVGPEIGPVRAVAGLVRPAAGIAADDLVRGGRFDHAEEGEAGRHIGKGIAAGRQ